MNNKKITFKSIDEVRFASSDKPYPASKAMPEWWKSSPSLVDMPGSNLFKTSTFKRCSPMLDAISAGYIVPLHTDLEVVMDGDKPFIRWNGPYPSVDVHVDEKVNGLEIPVDCYQTVFKYLNSWTIQTPPGYSVLITHPFGYKNLPFHAFTGIADSDMYYGDINVPFVIKKGFTGIIQKGTPMYQVIPFKREKWDSDIIEGTNLEREKAVAKIYTKIHSGYTKLLRQTKEYR